MFQSLTRSWEIFKASWVIVLENPRLLFYIVLEFILLGGVFAAFGFYMKSEGMFERSEEAMARDPKIWVMTFILYFCTYTIAIFFNCALIGSVLKLLSGRPTSFFEGLQIAMGRIWSILLWAAFAAVVKTILEMIAKRSEGVTRWLLELTGGAWNMATFFVVPYLVIQGCDPITALKRSVRTFSEKWDSALVGEFTFGVLTMVFVFSFTAVFFAIGALFSCSGIGVVILFVAGLGTVLVLSSTAEQVFKALLFQYASNRSIPENFSSFQSFFKSPSI